MNLPPLRTVPSYKDGRCLSLCKGDRGAADSPAKFGHRSDGTKVLYCPCCMMELVTQRLDVQGAPPNIVEKVAVNYVRMEDPVCGYDVVILRDIVSA